MEWQVHIHSEKGGNHRGKSNDNGYCCKEFHHDVQVVGDDGRKGTQGRGQDSAVDFCRGNRLPVFG